MPRPKPPYAQTFRDQMVELVRSGHTPSELSKEFGCHVSSILSWVRKAGGSGATLLPADAAALNAQERQELIELRRILRQVQIERDILAKATAWFAKARGCIPRLRTREGKSGRAPRSPPVRSAQGQHQRLLRLARARARHTRFGQYHLATTHPRCPPCQ